MKKFNFLEKSFNNILLLLYFILLFPPIFLLKKLQRNTFIMYSEIEIIINKAGNKNILYSDFYYKPDEVFINGIPQNKSSIFYNFTGEENIIKMKWNDLIDDCAFMFYELDQTFLYLVLLQHLLHFYIKSLHIP